MTTKTKIAAVALALTTLAGGMAATTNEAHAGKKGKYFAIGVASGFAIGALAAHAHSGPVYVYRHHKRCRWVDQFDAWGNYMGTTRVCRRFW